MTTNDPNPHAPYARDRVVDKPGIAGARWWHATLVDQAAQIKRRDAIRNILIAGGVIAGFGAMLAMCVKATGDSGSSTLFGGSPGFLDQRKTSLEMQKEFGWAFGAAGEALVFDGVTTKPFQAGALQSLSTDLAPSSPALVPYFQPTLFQSPDAVPPSLNKLEDPAEGAAFRPLSLSMKPIFTPAMDAAYSRGKSVASIFASLSEIGQTPASAKVALIVDLPGPEAVAFAAGAASIFDPVFLFDNWPHPRGVVRAQETLSAAAYYQPLFAAAKRAATGRAARSPMFVLDRRRIATYTDDATQFDNRYVAKLPGTAALMRALGVAHVLYVVPTRVDASRELDDINDELVLYSAGGIDVKALSLDMFGASVEAGALADAAAPPSAPGQANRANSESDRLLGEGNFVYYGGTRGSHHAFFSDYPWARPARAATSRPASNPGKSYSPIARSTSFSTGSPVASVDTKPRPTGFSTVPVAVAVGTGVVLGARYSRSGSWNRTSSSSSSGS